MDAYKNNITIEKISLQYIDAANISGQDSLNFVNNNFNVQVIPKFEIEGKLKASGLNQVYRLEDDSDLSILLSTGAKQNGDPALIWQTIIQKENSFSIDEILVWVDKNHKVLSDLFKKLITPKFYESFL
jgi:uncharacterized protein (TIGR04255 family)